MATSKKSSAISLSIALRASTIAEIVPKMPANIAVLVKGPTGVGKSHIMHNIAAKLGLPLIDVRGSTMDESGVTGIPDFEGSKLAGVSYFLATSWFKRACEEPVVLFLDELNRSMPQVMQSFFQIVLDRQLGNDQDGTPRTLHPDTRVVAAINAGNDYDVNEMDPALLRRFWVVDFQTDHEDWLVWAEQHSISAMTRDFIRSNPNELRVDPGSAAPGKVLPCPASWDRMDTTLRYMGWNPDNFAGQSPPEGFYQVCAGFIGTEGAAKFRDHVQNSKLKLQALDVLDNFSKVKTKIDRNDAAQLNELLDKVLVHIGEHQLSDTKQKKNLRAFCEYAGGEVSMRMWMEVTSRWTSNPTIVTQVHAAIGELIVKYAVETQKKST